MRTVIHLNTTAPEKSHTDEIQKQRHPRCNVLFCFSVHAKKMSTTAETLCGSADNGTSTRCKTQSAMAKHTDTKSTASAVMHPWLLALILGFAIGGKDAARVSRIPRPHRSQLPSICSARRCSAAVDCQGALILSRLRLKDMR